MPDYTQQLHELIQVLSRRDMVPSWAIALIGAIVGVLSSFLIQMWRDRSVKNRLTRATYREFAKCYWELSWMRTRLMANADTVERIHQEHASRITFDNYQYAKHKPDVFYDPAFISDTEELYHVWQRVAAGADDPIQLLQFINAFRRTFQEKVANKRLKWSDLRRVSPPTVKDELEELAHGRRKPDE